MELTSIVPRPNDDFCVRKLGNETIFLAEDGSNIHTVDEVGTFIWEQIDGKISLQEILERIIVEYEVDEERARDDLGRFVAQLAETKLINLESSESD